MPTRNLLWIPTPTLRRTVEAARQAPGIDPAELFGAERALAAASPMPAWRFTMLLQHGFEAATDRIEAHARHPRYTMRLFNKIVARADDHGLLLFETDQFAAELRIPRRHFYSCLLDLERDPGGDPAGAGAITRIMHGRHVRGVQLTPLVHRQPAPRPGKRNGRPEAERRRAA